MVSIAPSLAQFSWKEEILSQHNLYVVRVMLVAEAFPVRLEFLVHSVLTFDMANIRSLGVFGRCEC